MQGFDDPVASRAVALSCRPLFFNVSGSMDPVNRWFWCGCSDTGEVCILGAVHWSQSVSFRFDSTLKSLVRLPGHHC